MLSETQKYSYLQELKDLDSSVKQFICRTHLPNILVN